jgi:hypothetical protein
MIRGCGSRRLMILVPLVLLGCQCPASDRARSGSTRTSGSASAQPPLAGGGWKPVRIGGGGFVTGLVIHPRVPDRVYARTDVGGAYRYHEAEGRWVQLVTASRMPSRIVGAPDGDLGGGIRRTHAYQVESIAIDPSAPGVLYLALGGDLSRDGWMVKSTNDGESFELLSLAVPMGGNAAERTAGERLAVDPQSSKVVYFGSRNRGLWRSLDGGARWSRVEGVPPGNGDVGVAVVKLDAASGKNAAGRTRRVYASVAGSGVYASGDAGATWSKIHDGFAVDLEVVEGVLYGAMKGRGLFRYAASEWRDISPRGDRSVEDIAVDAKDHRRIFAISEGFRKLYRSTDAGATWKELRTNHSAAGRGLLRSPRIPWIETSTVRDWLSVGEIALDPHRGGRMWFAEGMGVWRSDDASDTNDAPSFENVSEGIEELVATGIAASGGIVVVTAWDRIGFQFSDPDRPPRRQLGLSGAFSMGTSVEAAPGLRGVFAVAVTDMRGCCGDGNFSGYTLDAGATWRRFGSIRGMTNEPPGLKFGEIAISASDPTNLVWVPRNGQNKIFASFDAGESWKEASIQGFANANAPYLTTKRVLTADPIVPGRFYAYGWQPGRVHRSADRGASWTAAPGSLPSGVWHGQLRAEPLHTGRLWFCTGPDYRGPIRERGLYASIDAGTSFSRVPAVEECWAVGFGRPAPGSSDPAMFMYGKHRASWGVFMSTNRGVSWRSLGAHPLGIFSEVASIAGDPERFGRVYVGFRGNGFAYRDADGAEAAPPSKSIP